MDRTDDITLRIAVLTAGFCALGVAVYGLASVSPSPIPALVLPTAPLVAVVVWLQKDSKRTGVGSVGQWGLWIWIAWPVVIPWYAFKSRGRQGWRLWIGLTTLICALYLMTVAVAGFRYAMHVRR